MMEGDPVMEGGDGQDMCIHVTVFYAEDKSLSLDLDGRTGTTVGEVVQWVREFNKPGTEGQPDINFQSITFDAYPRRSNTKLRPDQGLPDDGHLRLVVKGLEKQCPRLYEATSREVLATPKPVFIRQEANNYSILENLLELIDNAISATWSKERADRYQPLITINLNRGEDDEDATLVVEDNGHGMSKEVLDQVLISAFSYSAGPPVLGRTSLPLPLDRYINRHFNRYGRGLHALFFFGDHVVIDSRVPGAVQGHQIEADYREWQEAHAKYITGETSQAPYRCQTRDLHDFGLRSSKSASGETCVRISKLRPSILQLLRDESVQKYLQKEVAAVYHLHLHGFERSLFQRLPACLRQSSLCPKPTVTIKMLDLRMGKGVNQQPFQDDFEPLIYKLATTTAGLYARHQGMKPFVLCARYEPVALKGKAATGEGLQLDLEERQRMQHVVARQQTEVVNLEGVWDAEQQLQQEVEDHWLRISRAASQNEHPHAPLRASNAATPQAGGRRGRGGHGGRGGGSRSVPVTPKALHATPGVAGGSSGSAKIARGGSSSTGLRRRGAEDGADARHQLQQDDLQEHRGPLSEIDHEKSPPPAFVDMACILDYFLLEDGQPTKPTRQLGAIPIWSGRVLPNERNKDDLPDFVAAAKEMARQLGVRFYNRLDAERIGGLLMVSPECTAAMHKTQATDPAYHAFLRLGSSMINGDADEMPEKLRAGNLYVYNYYTKSFELDNDGALATSMLVHHYCSCWAPLDDMGSLEQSYHVDEDGTMVQHAAVWRPPASMKDKKGSSLDPLAAGEIVRIKKTTGTDEVNPGKGDSSAYPCNYFVIKEFTQVGSDQPFVHLTQWRPSWSQQDGPCVQQERLQVLRICPLAAAAKDRQTQEQSLVKKMEGEAPHHLAFKKDGANQQGTTNPQEAASLGLVEDAVYSTPHTFNEVQLVVVSKNNRIVKDASSKFKAIRLEAKHPGKHARLLDAFRPVIHAVLYGANDKQLWEGRFDVLHGASASVAGFGRKCQKEGEYKLVMTAVDGMGILHEAHVTQSYTFTVISAQEPPCLSAKWQQCPPGDEDNAWATAVAGKGLPPVLLSCMRGSRVIAVPHSDDLPTLQMSLLLALHPYDKPAAGGADAEEEAEGDGEGGEADGADEGWVGRGAGAGPSSGAGAQRQQGSCSRIAKPIQLKLTRAMVAPTQEGSVLISDVKLPDTLLRVPGRRSLPQANFRLSISLLVQRIPHPHSSGSRMGEADAPMHASLKLNVTSGMPSSLVSKLQLHGLGISKNDVAPEITLILQDENGAPWFNPAAQQRKDAKQSKSQGKGVKGVKGQAARPTLPHAVFELHNCVYRMARGSNNTSGTLDFDSEGVIELPEGSLRVTGPASGEAKVTFRVSSESLMGLVPLPQALERTLSIPISKVHITFAHPDLTEFSSKAARAADIPGSTGKACDGTDTPVHGKVDLAYVLDMLPYAKDLWEYTTHPMHQLPVPEAMGRQVLDGLQARAHDILVAPTGAVYRGSTAKKDVCADLACAQDCRVYHPVLVIGPLCTEVSDVRITITDYVTDRIDDGFSAPFKVLVDGKHDAFPHVTVGSASTGDQFERQPEDGYTLPPVDMTDVLKELQPRSGQPIRHTVPLSIVDSSDNSIVYGEVYVRQTPHPVAMSLLPLGPAFCAAASAASSAAEGGPSSSSGGHRALEATLRIGCSGMPALVAASAQDTVASAGGGGSGSKRGRGGAGEGAAAGGTGRGAAASGRNCKEGVLSPPSLPSPAGAAASGSNALGGDGADGANGAGSGGAAAGVGPGGSSSFGAAGSPQPPLGVHGWGLVDKSFPATHGSRRAETKINWWHDRLLRLDSPLQVHGRVPFQVHFMLLDQLDVPIPASEHVQRHIAATATLTLAPSGAAVAKRSGMLARIAGNWQWNVEAPGPSGTKPLPIHSVMVEVTSGVGQGTLTLQCEDVRVVEGATCSATLAVSLPLLVSSGPVAPQGLSLSSPSPQCTLSPLVPPSGHAGSKRCGFVLPNEGGGGRQAGETGGEEAGGEEVRGAGSRRGKRRREQAPDNAAGSGEHQAMEVEADAGGGGQAAAGSEGLFTIPGLLACSTAGWQQQQQPPGDYNTCQAQQLQALLPHLATGVRGVRGVRMETCDGGPTEVVVDLYDAHGYHVSHDAKLELVPLEGWLADLDLDRTGGMAAGAGRSGSGRVLQCKRGQASFVLKVPPNTARTEQPPQRLLIKPSCPSLEGVLPVVCELVLSPGTYPAHLVLDTHHALLSNWEGDALAYQLSNLEPSDRLELCLPKLKVRVLDGSGEPVPASELGPVKRSLRCAWQHRVQVLAASTEPAQPSQAIAGHAGGAGGGDDGLEEGEELSPPDARGQRYRLKWQEVEAGEVHGWCPRPGPPSKWVSGSSVAVWDAGAVAVPRRADAFRLAISADGLPSLFSSPVEVDAALPLRVGLLQATKPSEAAAPRVPQRNRPTHIPLDVEGKNLQVVTRAQLEPHGYVTPRATVTAYDAHENQALLPSGTMFELVVVQQQEQGGQQQEEWVVGKLPVKVEREELEPESAELCINFTCYFSCLDLANLPKTAEELAPEGAPPPPLVFRDGRVYALRVRARLPKDHPVTNRCIKENADMVPLAQPHCPSAPPATGSLHAPSAGAGIDAEGTWVLHTLTLCSFVVASAEDEELRRQEAELRGVQAVRESELQKAAVMHKDASKALATKDAEMSRTERQLRAMVEEVARKQQLASSAGNAGGSDRRGGRHAPSFVPPSYDELRAALQQKLMAHGQGHAPAANAAATRRSDRHGYQAESSSVAAVAAAGDKADQTGHASEGRAWQPQPVIASDFRGADALTLQDADHICGDLKLRGLSVLGPVAKLVACEREDVARALSTFLGSRLYWWIVLKKEHAHEVLDYLRNSSSGSPKVLGLQDHAIRYEIEPVDDSHPQQLLNVTPQSGVQQALESDPSGRQWGFIGYAANLVHFPQDLLQQRVIPGTLEHGVQGGSQAGARRPLTLRQTLCTYLFRKIMVFESCEGWKGFKDAMDRAKTPILRQTSLLGLDGSKYNMHPGLLEAEARQGSKAHTPQVCLDILPIDLLMEAPMDLRVQRVVNDLRQLQDAHDKHEQARKAHAKARSACSAAEAAREAAKARLKPEMEATGAQLQRVQAELERIHQAKSTRAPESRGPASASGRVHGSGARGHAAHGGAGGGPQATARAQQLHAAQAIMGQGLRSSRGPPAGPEGGSRGSSKRGGGDDGGGHWGEEGRKQARRG